MKMLRTYDHRGGKTKEAFGRIGQAELVAPDGEWTLDGKPLPESSIAHLLNFAMQTLQDAYAGADSAVEAIGAFEKKRDALLAGTIGVRDGGSSKDPVMELAESMARDDITLTFAAMAKVDAKAKMPRMSTIRDNLDKDGKAKLSRFGAFGGKNGNAFEWDSDAVAAYVDKHGFRTEAEKELARRAETFKKVDLSKLDI